MGLLEKLRYDGDDELEIDAAQDILEKIEATREIISPRRVIFASATVVSLLLVTVFTVIWVVPYDRVSVDVVYRQGASGHVVLLQLDNQGSREISDISISIRFTNYEGAELGRTDFFLDTLPAHSFYAGDNLELMVNGASVWEDYQIEISLEYNYYNGRGDERWTHQVGDWTMELFTNRAEINIF
tara:strand:- start:1804 stop:2358 length:555 start_codon:yes stop_codon:yes gene_type:complete